MEKFCAIVLSLTILLQGMMVRRVVGTWLSPAGLFSLFWFLYTFVPLVLFPAVPVEPWSIAYILAATCVFSASACFFPWRAALERNREKRQLARHYYNNRLFVRLFYAATACSLLLFLANSYRQGITLSDLVFNFYGSANEYLERRYGGTLSANWYNRLGIVFAYLGSIMGGFLCQYAEGSMRRFRVIVLSFLPSVFVMVTQSARGMLLLALGLFFGALLLARLSDHQLKLVDGKVFRRLLLYAALTVPLIAISFVSKGLYKQDDPAYVIQRLVFYFSSYSSAHLYAFSDWFAHIIDKPSVTYYYPEGQAYGFHTFMSVFQWLGDNRFVPEGYYDEYYTYGDLLSSNVYTIFRGLIMDFGLAGSLVYLWLVGMLLHLSFCLLLLARRPVITAAIFVFMFGYIYNSFTISLLIWNSVYASFLLFCGVLFVNKLGQSSAPAGGGVPAVRAGGAVT